MKKSRKVRMTFSFPIEIEVILRELADKTGLKMSMIVEKGILILSNNENIK